MVEKTVQKVYFRLKKIFKSNVYIKNLTNPKNTWLDLPTNDVIDSALKYIEELSNEVIGV